MISISEILAIAIVFLGTAFSIIGVLGFHRLPDVYTRPHATGKVGVLGVVMLLLAGALVVNVAWSKILVLIIFLLIFGPVTGHALISAAFRLSIEMKEAHRNDLHQIEDLTFFEGEK